MGDQYLICKYGKYYRPNAQGYTSSRADAGRYSLADAIRHSHPNGPNGPRDGITYELAPPEQPTPEAADELTALRERVVELEGALGRIVNAPMIDHRNPENSAQNIARAILSRPQQGSSDATKRMEQTLGAKFKDRDNG